MRTLDSLILLLVYFLKLVWCILFPLQLVGSFLLFVALQVKLLPYAYKEYRLRWRSHRRDASCLLYGCFTCVSISKITFSLLVLSTTEFVNHGRSLAVFTGVTHARHNFNRVYRIRYDSLKRSFWFRFCIFACSCN